MDPLGVVSAGISLLDGFFGSSRDGEGSDAATSLGVGAAGGSLTDRNSRQTGSTGLGGESPSSPVDDSSIEADSREGGNGNSGNTAGAADQQWYTQRTVLTLQAALIWLYASSPYFLLLLLVFVAYHWLDILMVAWMLYVIVRSNHSLSHQIALRQDFKQHECFELLVYISANSWIVVFLTSGLGSGQLWSYLIFKEPGAAKSIVNACFLIIMSDSLVCLWSMILKVFVVLIYQSRSLRCYMLSASSGPTQWGGWGHGASSSARGGSSSHGMDSLDWCHGRPNVQEGRMLTMLEYASRTYRLMLPMRTWCAILLDSIAGSPVLCSLFVGVYLTLKLFSLVKHFRLLALSAMSVMRKGALHGRYTTRDELQECGHAVCPICQEHVEKGVRLDCNHVFCDSCIGEWLERGRTCPMCRAEVRPPGLVSFGDGRTSLLSTLF